MVFNSLIKFWDIFYISSSCIRASSFLGSQTHCSKPLEASESVGGVNSWVKGHQYKTSRWIYNSIQIDIRTEFSKVGGNWALLQLKTKYRIDSWFFTFCTIEHWKKMHWSWTRGAAGEFCIIHCASCVWCVNPGSAWRPWRSRSPVWRGCCREYWAGRPTRKARKRYTHT